MRILNNSYFVLLVFVSLLYLVLNYGFMQVRFPYGTGFGIPIGEWLLILGLPLVKYKYLGNRIFILFFIWWIYTAILLIFSVIFNGFWALRDGSHVIESLYVLVGFSLVIYFKEKSIYWFVKISKVLALLLVVYTALYFIRDQAVLISPVIITGAGYEVPFLFHYLNTPYLLLTLSMVTLISSRYEYNLSKSIGLFFLAIIILLFDLLLFPSRTLYLQIIFSILFLLGLSNKFFLYFLFLLSLVFLLITVFDVSGIVIQSRTGINVNLDYLFSHLMSISGQGVGDVAGSAEGVGLRLQWWNDIFDRLLASIPSFFFGLGYGMPLVDFVAIGAKYAEGGQVVREPHNSFISIFGRSGLVGFSIWSMIMINLSILWIKVSRKFENKSIEKLFLNIVMLYSICLLVLAIGEDSFEKPYNAIFFYLLWGMVIGLAFLTGRPAYVHKDVIPGSIYSRVSS